MLVGPRRVGKSVELKRAIKGLIDTGTDPRSVLHAACNGWRARDLTTLLDVAGGLMPRSPRFLFLDEVSGIADDWVSRIAWLRDNTAMRDDCVVLSGSSAARLREAQKALAGRRGMAAHSYRTLLPMGFRAFCEATGVALPELQRIHPRDMLGPPASRAVAQLRPYLSEHTIAWERYLTVGGFPNAVADWVSARAISDRFRDDLWEVIHGDALRASGWSAAQSQELLQEIAGALSSPFNISAAARDLGGLHHEALQSRLRSLTETYTIWACSRNEGNRPSLRSQQKIYFLDPLQARLASLRRASARAPDYTQLSEQQIGVTLLRCLEAEEPGRLSDYDAILYQRTKTRKEIDFTGSFLGGLPYEAKYTEGRWLREAATVKAAYGRGVLTTRNVSERHDDLLAVPAAFAALLLDPAPSGAAVGEHR